MLTTRNRPPAGARDESRATRVYRYVSHQVNTGGLPPGTRLFEQDLATRLDVSRTPVREALRRLESDGIIESRSPRGFVVANPEREAMSSYLIRQELEGLAAKMAAERVTVQELRALDDLLNEMEGMAPSWPRNMERMAQMHAQFHDTINQLADSPQLYKFIAQVSPYSVLQHVMRNYDRESLARSMAGHREIVKALWDRDGARAQRLSHEHMEHSKPIIVRLDAGLRQRHNPSDH